MYHMYQACTFFMRNCPKHCCLHQNRCCQGLEQQKSCVRNNLDDIIDAVRACSQACITSNELSGSSTLMSLSCSIKGQVGYLRPRSSRELNHLRCGKVVLAASQDSHSSQVIEAVFTAGLKLRVVWCTEHCHQLALCMQCTVAAGRSYFSLKLSSHRTVFQENL